MPSTTATKTTARQVNIGDMVSKTKSGTFAKVTSLSPGANSVWITFEKGNRIGPGFDTPVWVLAETPETPAPAAEAPKAKPATPAAEVPAGTFMAYLEARTSGQDAAPHVGLPFITEKGILRVEPSSWLEYLAAEGIEVAKRQALEALRAEGLVQRVYPLPAVEGQEALAGKSFGLYTGKATPAMASLPRRAGAAPAAKAATPAPQVAAAESNGGVAKVAASTLAVGDAIGTTRTDTRKAIEAGEGRTIAAITTSRDGRVQARDAHGKVIRLAATTEVWAGRDNAPSDAAHANA